MRHALRGILALAALFLFTGCNTPSTGAFLSVDKASCSGCKACMAVCPSDAIRIISHKAVIDPAQCIQCGVCVDACPGNAIY